MLGWLGRGRAVRASECVLMILVYRVCRICKAVIADNDEDSRHHAEWHRIIRHCCLQDDDLESSLEGQLMRLGVDRLRNGEL